MRKAVAILGSGYGDEGKGAYVDYFSQELNGDCVNVRFNGGTQAGHNVVYSDGKHHSYAQIGAGARTGATTYYTEDFIINPITFRKEMEYFKSKFGFTPKIVAHPACMVSTPYDMILNRIIEDTKKEEGKHHGSCGLGINETVERYEQLAISKTLTISNFSKEMLSSLFNRIYTCYLIARLDQIEIDFNEISDEYKKQIDLDFVPSYIDDLKYYNEHVKFMGYNFLKEKNLVFEGAQGLLLDQNYGKFPHVTRSNTGVKNIVKIAPKIGLERLEVIYVTRWYSTRHGQGTMSHECFKRDLSEYISEYHNVTNQYQENFRYGHLDLNELWDIIGTDLSNKSNLNVRHNIAVSCMDQADKTISYFLNKELKTTLPEVFLDIVNPKYVSYGSTRNDIKLCINPITEYYNDRRKLYEI